MTKVKRVFLVVLDSFGVGAEPDAAEFGDVGTNTLAAVTTSSRLIVPNMKKLGLFNLDGVTVGEKETVPMGSFGRLQEKSRGKDTTIGHWELAGIVSNQPLPTFPQGFPEELLEQIRQATGRDILCNRPYSGTDVIRDYGEQQLKTGALIVYTSADSVLQIAAQEEMIPPEELYDICRKVRKLCKGPYAVGRVIARPYVGKTAADFQRTANRHDFSLTPPRPALMDCLKAAGKEVIAVGKIHDIFAGEGMTQTIRTKGNDDGIQQMLKLGDTDFSGLAFINLVDFDMLYGHRRDVNGYAAALSRFDECLPQMYAKLGVEDVLMITADHGCDPSYTKTTDHTREYVPWLIYGPKVKAGVNLGTIHGFGAVGATVVQALGVKAVLEGTPCWEQLEKT